MEPIGDGKRFAAAELWNRWIQDMVKTVTEHLTQLIAKERKRWSENGVRTHFRASLLVEGRIRGGFEIREIRDFKESQP